MFRTFSRAPSHAHDLQTLRARRRARLRLEELEARTLLSVFTPAQIGHAYGFDQIRFTANGSTIAGDGSGQTIAIVDAFNDPNIRGDLHAFDSHFHLPDPVLMVANPRGVLPPAEAGWAQEIALDVEWAHAMAPGAKILLVEASSDHLGDLLNAVSYAARQPGVTTVSMSWGASEFANQTLFDSVFTTPAGHSGVTFVASSGDSSALFGVNWPAASPNVLSVGGTSLRVSDNLGTFGMETGWFGSGGGVSALESEPAYQVGVQSTGFRTTPDVSYAANPYTGYYVYDTYQTGGAWFQAGGTSAGAPQWAALIAIANQGRALAGKPSLDGPTQTLPALYALAQTSYATYFHDTTRGSNGYAARSGYDLVTGLGSPKANALVSGLVGGITAGTHAVTSVTTVPTGPASASKPHADPGSSSPGSSQGDTGSGSTGQQTPARPTVVILVVTANPFLATAAGLSASQTTVSPPALAVSDPRGVPLATPAPPVAVPRVESGGGNNPLLPQEQDQPDEPDTVVPDLSSSAKAPRMAPARPPEAVAQATALSWRRVCDLCFANDQWTAPPAAEEPAPAFEESGTLDSMAALVGLGVVLGSYWAAPPAEVDRHWRGDQTI